MKSRHLLKSSVIGKVLLLITLCLSSILSRAQQNEYVIDGNLAAVKNAVVYLVGPEYIVLDSSDVKNGQFQLKGSIPRTTGAFLALTARYTGYKDSKDFKNLFIEPGYIKVKSTHNLKDAVVSGTVTNDDVNTLKDSKKTDSIDTAIDKLIKTSTADQKQTEDYRKKLTALNDIKMEQYKTINIAFIKSHTNSLVSLRSLAELSDVVEFDVLNPLYNGFSDNLKNSEEGKKLAERLSVLKKVAIGAVIPDMVLPDVNGKMVNLSSFRGKYLFVDVWAAWCGPCRTENPNLVAAYNKYKMKNFDIVSISLDNEKDKEKWLAAIQKDGLTWTQLSDLKMWESEAVKVFGLSSIPQSYLVDPNGIIISKNLTGENLNAKLKEIL